MEPPYRESISPPVDGWEAAARAEIQRQLQPHEQILWVGRPAQGLRFTQQDIFLVPFSLMWGGFACFWEYNVLSHGAPAFFGLWGIPFVAMGVYIIVGRFFVDRARRARTVYGLTSRRALIVKASRLRSVTSIDLTGQPEFDLRERGNGRGTIVLGPALRLGRGVSTNWPGSGSAGPSFEEIEDARAVYNKLLEAQRAARRSVISS